MSYIKLDRKILNWGWYKDSNTLALWLHLLLSANYKRSEFMGETINAGELATSLGNLSEETGLSLKQVRTCLEKLKKTNEIQTKRCHRFLKISITKWSEYQMESNERAFTGHLQGIDRAFSGQHKKNIKNEKNIYNSIPVYDTSKNIDMDEDEEQEILALMGRA